MKTKMKTLLMLAFIGLSVMSFAQTTIYVNAGETLRLKCWSETSPGVNESLDTDCQVNLNGTEDGEFADTILARGPFYMEMGNTDDQYLYYDWLGGVYDTHTVLVEDEGEWTGGKYHQGTGYEYVGFFWIRFIHIANFTVSDAGGNPIGATVSVTGQTTQTTDGSGNCSVVDLEDGTYSYSVTASGYDAVNSSFTVSGGDVAVNVQMTETTAPTYTVNFSVSPSTKGISGATVSLTGYGDQVTDGSGTCSFTDIPDGTYNYTVTASGYQNASGSVTVSGGDVSETVYMNPLGVGNITEVELNVYPNPVVDYLTIDSRYHDVQWTVYNLTGQVVKVGEGEIVDMKDLRAAYYVLKVTSANVFYKKVLKTE